MHVFILKQFLAFSWCISWTFAYCVVPENIHTPTTEGISLRTPSSPDFPFFEVSYNPPIPPYFPQFVKHPPTPLENFVQEGRAGTNAPKFPALVTKS